MALRHRVVESASRPHHAFFVLICVMGSNPWGTGPQLKTVQFRLLWKSHELVNESFAGKDPSRDTPVEALWLLGFVGCDTPVGCVGGGCGVGFSLAAARGLVRFFRVGVVGVFGGLRTQ